MGPLSLKGCQRRKKKEGKKEGKKGEKGDIKRKDRQVNQHDKRGATYM